MAALTLAAWLLAAGVLVACRARERRRIRSLREAVHELRRPLQALALGAERTDEDPLVAQLRTALADLDDAVAGRRPCARRESFSLAELLEDARRRWVARDGSVRVEGAAEAVRLEADRVHLGMAVDNLIANGLEHGRGPVELGARVSDGSLLLEVRNGRRRGRRPPKGKGEGPRGLADPRRGHGLRIAGRVAAAQAGALIAPRPDSDGRIVAGVELPRSDGSGGR